jgi:hypothetical protein
MRPVEARALLGARSRGGFTRPRSRHVVHSVITDLAQIMGTSIVQIEDTYARWLKRTDEQLRAAFDAYDANEVAAL